MQKIRILQNDTGQVAIEFILVMGFAMGITFLFVKQAFNATEGYLVHYANFMASRAYLTSDSASNNPSSVYTGAARVAKETFERFPLGSFGIEAEFNTISFSQGSGLFQGTTAKFEREANFLPGVGGGEKAKLLSESFLGKEPSRATCYQMVCAAITGGRDSCSGNVDESDITLYDNGC